MGVRDIRLFVMFSTAVRIDACASDIGPSGSPDRVGASTAARGARPTAFSPLDPSRRDGGCAHIPSSSPRGVRAASQRSSRGGVPDAVARSVGPSEDGRHLPLRLTSPAIGPEALRR